MAQLNDLIVNGNSRFISRASASGPINQIITGTGTAASSSSGVYYPAKWTFNTGCTATNGDTLTIKMPTAGHDYGVYVSIDNGTNYYPVIVSIGSRLTTHYPADTYINLVFDSNAFAYSMYPINGGSSRVTVSNGAWRVINYYDSGNDTGYYTRKIYSLVKAGSNKVFPYTLVMECSDGRLESIVTSSSTGTTKSRNTHGFRLGQIYLMYQNSTYNENVVIDTYRLWTMYSNLFDHRYSFNTANDSTNGTTANKPVYLKGTINTSNGLFYLDTTWWTQTLPTTADGKFYIYLGDAYDYYRMTFSEKNTIYHYVNGAIREYIQDAGSVNGFTVEKSVPSNAVFTDNNTTYTFANGTNGFTVTPSGGSAQTVTVTPSISNNVTGSGTSGYIAKFNGSNTITNGPAIGSGTTKFLREDGTWQTPGSSSDVNVTQTATTTSANYEVLFSATADNTTRTEGARKNSNLLFNPSTGNLQATQLNGVAIGSSPKFTDNNTTYTFANGTNGFTVTPSGGSAQTVTVTPSISNNVTGSGTSGYLTKFNGANTITNGPQLGSSTTTFLSNAGTWLTPNGRGNKIYTVTPTTPYMVGDLYLADNNNILVCNTARSSGSYNSDDWGAAVDAIDNETLDTQIASEIAIVTGNSSSGGNVILRLNNGIPYEVLITDSPTSYTTSGRIYRWDSTGLRYTSGGYNGTYTTIINSSGQIPTSVLIGNINASVNAIQNFTAAMINGGKLERGAANNSKGTIELQAANGTVIAEVGNYGFKFYGPGSVGSRPYYIIDNSSNGIAGYTSAGAIAFKITTDEFRMPKAYIQSELNIGNVIKIVPTTSGSNVGISFVAAT